MKRIFFLVVCVFLVSSCFGKSAQIEQAKQQLLQTGATSDISLETPLPPISQDNQENTLSQEESVNPPMVQILPLTENQLIEINIIPESDVNDGEIQISGRTLESVDTISVSFSNPTSDFPDDDYTLQTFNSGDATFRYNASSRSQVLDYGKNTYIFTATRGDTTSQTEVSIIVLNGADQTITFEEKVIGTEENSVIVDLPQSEVFGEPLSLGTSSFTYSGIEGLEITKQEVSEITCEGLTQYLSDTINTWYYWNTCRDIVKDEGISFYVLRLTGDEEYVYQKHYVDYVHGFYAVYDIETGTGIDKENISEKNTQFKERNDTLQNVDQVDILIRSILVQN